MTERCDSLDIRKLIEKLGHGLQEVRQRSLENILSKLENDIITVEDLLHFRQLYEYLFQLINNEDCVSEALSLLNKLTEHKSGAEVVSSIGGVEFLSLFREDHPNDAGKVESVLNHLFHVREENAVHAVTCHNRKVSEFSPSVDMLATPAKSLFDHKIRNSSQQSTYTDSFFSQTLSQHNSLQQTTKDNVTTNPKDKQDPSSLFPFVLLTSSDRQILAVTENRLQSTSDEMVMQSCAFFRDVILYDFPAEVFIQRPNIFKNILATLTLYRTKRVDIAELALSCLTGLVECLFVRTLQQRNVDTWQQQSLFTDKQTSSMSTNQSDRSTLSSTIQPSVAGNSPFVNEEHEDVDGFDSVLMTMMLAETQLIVPEFVFLTLNSITDLLPLYIDNNNLFCIVYSLYHNVLPLLNLDDFKERWGDETQGNKNLIYQAITSIHKFEGVVQSDSFVNNFTKYQQAKHILVLKLMLSVIHTTVPDDKIYEVMTDQLVVFCQSMITLVSYMNTYPKLKQQLLHVIAHSDEQFYEHYLKTVVMVKSMKQLDIFRELLQQQDAHSDHLFLVAAKVVPSLHLHQSKTFIEDCVSKCSELYAKKKKQSFILFRSLLECEAVKTAVYSAILDVMKRSFSVSLVHSPLSTCYQGALLFIQKDVLFEIFVIGLHHKNQTVASYAKSITQLLLSSSLFMSTRMFEKILEILPPHLPYVQAALDDADDSFSQSVMSLFTQEQIMFNVSGLNAKLTTNEQIKSSLRCLFLKHQKVRQIGLSCFMKHFSNIKGQRSVDVPSVATLDQPENIFLFYPNEFTTYRSNLTGDCLSDSDVQGLLEVFNGANVSMELRESVLNQLAIILEDQSKVDIILNMGVLNTIEEEMDQCVSMHHQRLPEAYITSMICVLQKIFHHRPTTRALFSSKSSFIINLFHLSLLLYSNKPLRYELSLTLTYLLFNDAFASESEVTLRRPITKNYYLHPKFTAREEECELTLSCLPSGTLLRFMKASCFENCKWFENGAEESSHLSLSPSEVSSLTMSTLKHMETVMVQSIQHATEVCEVQSVLNSMKILVSLSGDADKSDVVDGKFKDVFAELFKAEYFKRLFDHGCVNMDDYKLAAATLSLIKFSVQFEACDILKNVGDFTFSKTIQTIIADSANSDENMKSILPLVVSTLVNVTTAPLYQSVHPEKIAGLIFRVYKHLSYSGPESYYDLPLMEGMLRLLQHLLRHTGWSLQLGNGKDLCMEMFGWLIQIVVSFHVDRVGASASYMGKGIVKTSAMCMCSLLHELKTVAGQLYEMLQNSSTRTLPWLHSLLSDRSVEIRLSAWAIATGFAQDGTDSELVANVFESQPGGIWAACLEMIVNPKECFLVRSQVCLILSELMTQLHSSASTSLWNSMLVVDTNTQTEITGIDAFMLLFNHYNLFDELHKMFINNFRLVYDSKYANATTSISNDSRFETMPNSSTSVSREKSTSITSDITKEQSAGSGNEVEMSAGSDYTSRSRLMAPQAVLVNIPSSEHTSLKMKSAVVNLISTLFHLSPDVILQHFANKLQTILRSWDVVTMVKQTNAKDWKSLRQHIKVAQSYLRLIRTIHLYTGGKTKQNGLFQETNVIAKMCQLYSLALSWNQDLSDICFKLWTSVSMLLASLSSAANLMAEISKHLPDHLQHVAACIHLTGQMKTPSKHCLSSLLTLVTSAFQKDHAEFSIIDSITLSSDVGAFASRRSLEESCYVGEILCHVLLPLFSTFHVARSALSCLLVVSKRAKRRALDGGLVETLVEDLKDALVKLNLLTFTDAKRCKDKQNALLTDVAAILDLMHNFCAGSRKVKEAFLEADIILHLFAVRIWAATCRLLDDTLLRFLVVLSFDCSKAHSLLCSITSALNKQALGETTFLSYVIKTVAKQHKEAVSVHGKLHSSLHLCFDVLCNVAAVGECRNVVYKANILSMFLHAYPLATCGNNHQRNVAKVLVVDWLRLITCLSFHPDGAKVINKIPGLVQVLVDMTNNEKQTKKQNAALLVLRNLLFLPAFKQSVTSNMSLLKEIIQKLMDGPLKTKTIACSYFWMLVHDNLKAKTALKKSDLVKVLCGVKEDLNSGRYLSVDGDLVCNDLLKDTVGKTIEFFS